ncbi:MBL fold metallo-hydrolase [Pseudobowmanella zhangzhouensis]|uniref:MBL fold metallo-hydrolase n=1 Tax=Pseudobowmanella zhangzhouensis TaxID=1537679 RepID=UPI0036234F00
MKIQVIPVTPFAQNCSFIWDEKSATGALVDPGGDLDKIRAAVDAKGVNITQIILTHGHLDHVGATVAAAEFYQCPIIGPHKDDEFWLQMLPQQSQMFGFPPAHAFTPQHYLEEGDNIQLGEITLQVIHCPGHTPGHVVLFDPASKQLIVGDVLFAYSIGRTDFPRGNSEQLISSIRNKLFTLGDDVVVYPGHGPTTTIGAEKHSNPFVADHRFG